MEICGDNRFEIIAKAKAHLLDATNIDTSEDEMKVLDNFLFRCWQMGWLDRYAEQTELQSDARKILGYACETCKHKDEEWDSEACDGCCENNDHYEKTEPQTDGYISGEDFMKIFDEPQTDCAWKKGE